MRGDPNLICDTVKDKLLLMFAADTEVTYYQGITGLSFFPTDPGVIASQLPVFTVDFSFPRWGMGEAADQIVSEADYLTVQYYHHIAPDDVNGEIALRAVRRALWMINRHLGRNASLWGTVDSCTFFGKKLEDLPLQIATTTGVAARWGWITFTTRTRLQPL